jgi:hypothetical protein
MKIGARSSKEEFVSLSKAKDLQLFFNEPLSHHARIDSPSWEGAQHAYPPFFIPDTL